MASALKSLTSIAGNFRVHSLRYFSAKAPDSTILQQAVVHPDLLKPYIGDILLDEDHFKMEHLVSVQDMFNCRVHYGHKVGTVNEKMKWALFGERLGVCIFDLEKSRIHMVKALNFIAHLAYRGGMFLFITSDRHNMLMVEKMAEEMGEYAHVRKWQEGTLLNSRQLLGTTVRLPDALIFLSTLTSVLETHPAVLEAAKMAIPTVGIVDSNSDPSYITYSIPGNDDTKESIQYYMKLFRTAIETGKRERALKSQTPSENE
ncbi:hypothetical protein AB6A40_000818 [Gnathostoma spinigerum]|uniref:Small ribosomal subunit protein uS2m n=1 Tax=Gnathostoma spinigerum TaxID=75299 RepID=A0ABD6E7F8_9BILA